MVARYLRSDLTQRAFCAQEGLPVSTLQCWLAKTRREAARPTAATFTEISMPTTVPGDPGIGPGTWAVEIVTRTGVTLRLREPVPATVLAALLRLARC